MGPWPYDMSHELDPPPARESDEFWRGDTVNIAARLASTAAGGEVLVTSASAMAAGLDPGLERRQLELKGREGLTEVVALHVPVAA
jgi:class 3 adenylate cyclase